MTLFFTQRLKTMSNIESEEFKVETIDLAGYLAVLFWSMFTPSLDTNFATIANRELKIKIFLNGLLSCIEKVDFDHIRVLSKHLVSLDPTRQNASDQKKSDGAYYLDTHIHVQIECQNCMRGYSVIAIDKHGRFVYMTSNGRKKYHYPDNSGFNLRASIDFLGQRSKCYTLIFTAAGPGEYNIKDFRRGHEDYICDVREILDGTFKVKECDRNSDEYKG